MQTTKKPTPKDLEILGYLKCYPHLSSLQIQKMAQTIDHRDCFFRLRKAGFPIGSFRTNYTDTTGKKKWYMNYFLEKQAA